jgi:DNA-binding LytR/AlgR family response regulator
MGTESNTRVRALVADDEPHLAQYLAARLAELWPELEVLPPAANGLEALRVIDDEAPQVAFLDIRMPGLTGLEVARRIDIQSARSSTTIQSTARSSATAQLTARSSTTHVVFVTAYDQYAVEAFDQDAVDYVLKPVTDERLARCIERLKRKLADSEAPPPLEEVIARLARAVPAAAGRVRWIRALKGDVVHQIAVDDVLYFNAADKYTRVVTREGEALIRTAIIDLAKELDPERFVQIHRSTIVNMDAVASSRRDLGNRVFVKLKDGKTELAVSRAYAQLFKQM